MPDLNPQFAQFQKDVETLLQELTDKLKKAGLSNVELSQLASEIDFFEELREMGFDELVERYFENYEKEIEKIVTEARAKNVDFANVDVEALNRIMLADKEYLLGKAKTWASQWESEMLKSMIRGETIAQTVKNMNEIPLTDAQLGTVLNTAYSDISRTATVEIYKDKPKQRFKYEGGIIPTSSEQCKWLMTSQSPEGYTMGEIQIGIETPYGMIYESGREPNFNCIHRWVAI